MMGGADQVLERVFEVPGKVTPVPGVQLQALQYRRELIGNCTFLVFTQDTATPVNQFEIALQSKGKPSGMASLG